MTETKYGQYIINAPVTIDEKQSRPLNRVTFRDNKPWSDWHDIDFSINYRCLTLISIRCHPIFLKCSVLKLF